MRRRPKFTTARETVLDVIRWARAAGFANIAAAQSEAVGHMPRNDALRTGRRQRL